MKIGTTVYFTENNHSVAAGIIIASKGTRYVIRIRSGRGVSLPESRLFLSREAAEQTLPIKDIVPAVPKRSKLPYDWE